VGPGGALLVGYDTKDDAAVYDIGKGRAIISTTDFFMPIVDDAFDFGKIASVNAISDVYAMGGKPLLAISILGWPIEKIPVEIAQQVIEGARAVCSEANIPLAGGHSIDSTEPIFGLAVTGEVEIKNIKRNSTATEGSKLFLTKPLGVGILTTAHKKGVVKNEDLALAKQTMLTLNSIGYEFGKLHYVKAMTDVTGFGLLGHLIEMCEASNLSAEIEFSKVPLIGRNNGREGILKKYIEQNCIPGGTSRNWKSYGSKVSINFSKVSNFGKVEAEATLTLCDPQTSGGLLVAVDANYENAFISFTKKFGLTLECFGTMKKKNNIAVTVIP
jgi:selenide,water dikinase